MDASTIEKCKDKLVRSVAQLERLKSEKKTYNASYNEQIRAQEKRIKVFSQSLESQTLDPLEGKIDEIEYNDICGRKELFSEQ